MAFLTWFPCKSDYEFAVSVSVSCTDVLKMLYGDMLSVIGYSFTLDAHDVVLRSDKVIHAWDKTQE
jgi:hypothetical protein